MLIRNEQMERGKVTAYTYLPMNEPKAKRANFNLHKDIITVTNRNCFGINKQHTVRYESLKKIKKLDFHVILSGKRNKPLINSTRFELSVKYAEVRNPLKPKQKVYHSTFEA